MSPRHTNHDEHRMACAVCAWPLEWNALTGFSHGRAALQDHVVIPVAYDQLVLNQCCDVCDRAATHWLPADDFDMGLPWEPTPERPFPTQTSISAWALCPECVAVLREHGVMKGLFRRAKMHVFSEMQTPRTPESVGMLYDTYSSLEAAAHLEQLVEFTPLQAHSMPGPQG